MAKLIFLCVDGSSSHGDIKTALLEACTRRNVPCDSGTLAYSKSAAVPITKYMERIKKLVVSNGGHQDALALFIVGKSLGGAKMYRLLHDKAEYLKQFAKVAVELVDPHEPLAPGNSGEPDRWYDYVHFSDDKSNLTWWNEQWGAAADQSLKSSRMRFFSIHQRNGWPKGYSMKDAYNYVCLTDKKVIRGSTGRQEEADHWNIAWCDKTVEQMVAAIDFLQEAQPV